MLTYTKKRIFRTTLSLLGLFCCSLPLQAQCWDTELSLRGVAFHPTSCDYREIYANWIAQGQVETGIWLGSCLQLWANAAYQQKDGRSLELEDKTELKSTFVSAGLKWYGYRCRWFDVYGGLGVGYTVLRIHDHSPYVIEHTNEYNLGAVAKSGVRLHVGHCYFLDFFADYSYQPLHFSHNRCGVYRVDADVGGLMLGVGIGGKL